MTSKDISASLQEFAQAVIRAATEMSNDSDELEKEVKSAAYAVAYNIDFLIEERIAVALREHNRDDHD